MSISRPKTQPPRLPPSFEQSLPDPVNQKPEVVVASIPWTFPHRGKKAVINPPPRQPKANSGLISGLIPRTCNRKECRCKKDASQTNSGLNHTKISSTPKKQATNGKTAPKPYINPVPTRNPLVIPCIDQCPIPGHLRDIVLQDVWDIGKVGSFVNHGYVAKVAQDEALIKTYTKSAGTATNLEVVKFCRPPTPSNETLGYTEHQQKVLFQPATSVLSSSSSSSSDNRGRTVPAANNTKRRRARLRQSQAKLDHRTVEQRLLMTRSKPAYRNRLPPTVEMQISEHETPATTNIAHEYSAALAWWYDTLDGLVPVEKTIPVTVLPPSDLYQYD